MARSRGFTLLEVLAAFAIMAVGLALLGNATQGSIGQAEYSRNGRTATLVADQEMAALMTSSNLDQQATNGTFDAWPDYPWSWTQTTKTLSINQGSGQQQQQQDQGQFIEITLTVTIPGRDTPLTLVGHYPVPPAQPTQGQGQGR